MTLKVSLSIITSSLRFMSLGDDDGRVPDSFENERERLLFLLLLLLLLTSCGLISLRYQVVNEYAPYNIKGIIGITTKTQIARWNPTLSPRVSKRNSV